MKARVTIKDVAEKMSCSLSTVSRALQNNPKISLKLTKRIQQVAEKMGYTPDPFLSALSAYRTPRRKTGFKSKILLVYSERFPEANPELSPWSKLALQGAQKEAERLGYLIEVLKMPKDLLQQEKIIKTMRYQAVAGYIFIHYQFTSQELALFCSSKTALVNLQGENIHSKIPTVDLNKDEAMTLAYEKLLLKKYQRIGFVDCFSKKDICPIDFTRTFLYQQHLNTKLHKIPILTINDYFEPKMLTDWIQIYKVDSIIFRGGEALYPLVKSWAKEKKAKIGFVGLEVFDVRSGCSGVIQCRDLLGEQAMQQIHRQLTSQQFPPMPHPTVTLISPEWVEGKTY